MTNLLNSSGVTFLVFESIIAIALNIFILIISVNNGLLRNKGKVIAFSVISFFVSSSTFGTLFSFINFIVALCIQRKNPEDFPEKKEMPKIEFKKPCKREFVFGIILAVVYFSQFLISFLIPEDLPKLPLFIIQILFYVVLFILAILAFYTELKKGFKLLKNNFRAYIQYILPRFGIMYVILVLSNLICTVIAQEGTSVNQSMIEEMSRWASVPLAVIWAPFVEELLFRGVLRRLITNKKLFIGTSALIFGLLHSIVELTLLNIIVMTIPYAILGGFLAYIYVKTENITTNISIHMFYNAVGMLLSSFLLFII